jgi:hypothetical protein
MQKQVGVGWVIAGLLVLGMASGGCGGREAEQAVAASQKAIDAIPAEAQQLMTAEYEQLQMTQDAAKQSLSERKFKQAVSQAQAATAMAESLATQAQARGAELTQEWSALDVEIPGMIAALITRVQEATKKLPAGVTAEALANAKTELERLPRQWDQARAIAQAGQLQDAVLVGRKLKSQCAELMTALAMPGAAAPAGAAPTGAAPQTPPAGSNP